MYIVIRGELTYNYYTNNKLTSVIRELYYNSMNFFSVHFLTSAMPEVRRTADVGWRSLFHLPLNPPRTHSRLYHHMCLRTDGP